MFFKTALGDCFKDDIPWCKGVYYVHKYYGFCLYCISFAFFMISHLFYYMHITALARCPNSQLWVLLVHFSPHPPHTSLSSLLLTSEADLILAHVEHSQVQPSLKFPDLQQNIWIAQFLYYGISDQLFFKKVHSFFIP